MSELPSIAGRQVVKALGKIGYELDRQRGSHIILRQKSWFFVTWYGSIG